ncbi:MAG: hypothetical protein MR874_05345 [Coriobacteriaceae bacterium]|uniref:hypothetical protein n=1 Tax=Tractidigestivibacter sp. TaxID=2847320 RepID=UPI002A83ACB6|nr:hypothetical protein [Tractidigestivibacter sp.]MCI6274931.1 hypothetical protein [Coriobacteriaceae bacterium]MCI6547390.1 hypothetical protein [Coriobacteriaceae bacterium]MCI6844167.1 hypothetical protein [Coriobacteriaceae bacterium]MCI7438263.1 hypothetical protein [Coriobacteriaceae bacterium]MDD7585271.1 hypothetical protein [Coriobacteriaceae bacterium]
MAGYTNEELQEAMEQYRGGDLSLKELERMYDEADREDEGSSRRRAPKKRGGWQPFVAIGINFDL